MKTISDAKNSRQRYDLFDSGDRVTGVPCDEETIKEGDVLYLLVPRMDEYNTSGFSLSREPRRGLEFGHNVFLARVLDVHNGTATLKGEYSLNHKNSRAYGLAKSANSYWREGDYRRQEECLRESKEVNQEIVPILYNHIRHIFLNKLDELEGGTYDDRCSHYHRIRSFDECREMIKSLNFKIRKSGFDWMVGDKDGTILFQFPEDYLDDLEASGVPLRTE